jgi:hypothetical protein
MTMMCGAPPRLIAGVAAGETRAGAELGAALTGDAVGGGAVAVETALADTVGTTAGRLVRASEVWDAVPPPPPPHPATAVATRRATAAG